MSATIRSITRAVRTAQRPIFAQTTIRPYSTGEGEGPSKTHTTDKPKVDVQSTPSNQAREGKKAESDNSGATQQSDTHNSNQRAANESKAPGNTVIGMNDERGGKGM